MSKSTIVSLLPFGFHREMTGHNPASYYIPKAGPEGMSVTVVEDSTSWVYILEGKSVQQKHLSFDVARELIDTYIAATQYVTPDAQPGLFYVEGKQSIEDIKEDFSELLEEAERKQNNWFANLVKEADDFWAKTPLHRGISDPQKLAAKALGLKRPWSLAGSDTNNFKECPACTTIIQKKAVICPQCRTDLREFEEATA